MAANLRNDSWLSGNESHWLWPEYYQEFPVFSAETVRIGCHPRKMQHPSGAKRAIVLVHGLSDSPYFMSAIGEYFHTVLGYDVYIPLLQCHGLKSPANMAGVALAEWLSNVRFAIRSAAQSVERVSIGGLSMGGALSYYLGCTDSLISGDLYLFSAALGLSPGPCALPGRFKEWLLRRPLIKRLDVGCQLVGKNPFRYDRFTLNSAAELARLICKINTLPMLFPETGKPGRRIFSAWSECDNVISLGSLRALQRRIPENRFTSFILSTTDKVDHACVVLQDPIFALNAESGSEPLERGNPRFAEMLTAIARFAGAS